MRYSHFAAATLTALALPTLAVADNHGNAEDQALMIVTSDAVQTQSMGS